ncbi:hypothetical protein JF550_03465 [Microbacterium esteraromaticum]|uniref:Lipoprotein n=1 Tax=Microbacterium esteraromaticum TaxID=57043 RepID=A0A939IUG8_9MICO|nr:hypothetical protein [Microbacterium esteraromaticum]MBN8205014.1 hypothetical protein [Microbacterium esteraromaticum]MBN8415168.1 hypothetical protein [Microbacterium esteraromaticum]MBN8424554.1 hypothetical protein [Microbacterium esteraromaticum]
MKRIIGGVLAIIGAMALAGCSSATATPDELQQWMDDQHAASDDAKARVTALALVPSADSTLDDLGEQFRVDFEEPEQLTEFEFSCFGAETMDVSVYMHTEAGIVGTAAVDVLCSDGPKTLNPGIGDAAVHAVTASAFSADGAGAWSLAVR